MSRPFATSVGAFALAFAFQGVAYGATFVVNSASNSSDSHVGDGICRTSAGVCTLRAAIQEANATSAIDTIQFAIGSGPQQIALSSNLPTITRPVIIDGSTQPGFSGVPLIEISGTSSLGNGIAITAGGSTIRSLVINGFGGNGIFISGGNGNVVEGCYIGLSADGSSAVPNEAAGVRMESSNNRVGGTADAQRNVVSGNTGRDILGGVMVYGQTATGNIIQGNYIGLDATGMIPLGNEGRGVAIHDSSGNFVGGAAAGAGNWIAGNRATGVRIWGGSSINNLVQGNIIGTNKAFEISVGKWPDPGVLSNARGVQSRGNNNYVIGNIIAGNTWDGVLFYDGTDKDFDPTSYPTGNVIYQNIIAYNGLNGIGEYVGHGNWFAQNLIFENAYLGIELADKELDGVTLNDPGDADAGGNDLQNYPDLTSATVSGSLTTIKGTLSSKANTTYYVEFFANPACDPSGYGEARFYIGNGTVATNASGTGSFSFVFNGAIPSGYAVTATATDPNHSTSELARCIFVQ